MKEREIKVDGFSQDTSPNIRPAICVYSLPNGGTTRFGMTMPHDEGCVAFLALDQNCRDTIEAMKKRGQIAGEPIPAIVNTKPFLSDKEAADLAMRNEGDSPAAKDKISAEIMAAFRAVVDRVYDAAYKLTQSDQVESIVVDKASQLYNWILYSRHGRSQQIDMLSRMVPNQDMIDLITMMRAKKNLLLIHRASEIYKKTGEVDKRGKAITEASGKYKPEAMGNIETFVTATIELRSKKLVGVSYAQQGDEDDEEFKERLLKAKYRAIVDKCKGNTLLEGTDLYDSPWKIAGDSITYENIAMALGIEG